MRWNRLLVDGRRNLKPIHLQTLLLTLGLASCLPACVPVIVAGAGTAAAATVDRRPYKTQLQDAEIEHNFNKAYTEAIEARSQASATAFNYQLLLSGQAIDQGTKDELEQIGRTIPNVREVFNELSIGYPQSFPARSNDAFLTAKVKTRLFENKDISAHHFKVVSEAGTVYLMGLVTEQEASIATEIARTTAGVRRVVRVFETISPAEAARLSSGKSQPAPVSDSDKNAK